MKEYKWTWTDGDSYYEETVESICPYCANQIAGKVMTVLKRRHLTEVIDDPVMLILKCPSCSKPIIYIIYNKQTIPASSPYKNVQKLPPTIMNLYWEVRIATASRCYTAAIGLARTIIMHIAVEKGVKENLTFKEYVNYIEDAGYIPPNSKEWVDRIRTLGNDSVHKLEERTQDEAELITKFLMYLLIFIYELPKSM